MVFGTCVNSKLILFNFKLFILNINNVFYSLVSALNIVIIAYRYCISYIQCFILTFESTDCYCLVIKYK